jgi:hypothetical protein
VWRTFGDPAIESGVNIDCFLEQNGLFTSAPGTLFSKKNALTPDVPLYPTTGHNFIKPDSKSYKVLNAGRLNSKGLAIY